MMDLSELDRYRIDDCHKGIPGGTPPFALSDVGAHHWNLLREDLPLPLAVLKESALEHNGAWMRGFLARTGVDIAPHGKTSMSPQLFAKQLSLGAWAITISNTTQLQVCRKFRVPRVFYANQLVGKQAVRIETVERGQQHPPRKIAGRAEQDEGRDALRHVRAICGPFAASKPRPRWTGRHRLRPPSARAAAVHPAPTGPEPPFALEPFRCIRCDVQEIPRRHDPLIVRARPRR